MNSKYRIRSSTVVLVLVMLGAAVAVGGGTAVGQTSTEVAIDDPGAEIVESGSTDLIVSGVDSTQGVGAFEVTISYNDNIDSIQVSDSDRFTVESETRETNSDTTVTIVGYTEQTDPSGQENIILAAIDVTSQSFGTTGEIQVDEVSTLVDPEGDDIVSVSTGSGASFSISQPSGGDNENDDDSDDENNDDENDNAGSGGGGGGGDAGTGTDDDLTVPDISDDLGDSAEISDESEGVITTDSTTGETSVTFKETSNAESIDFSEETSGTAKVRSIEGTPEATGEPPGTTVSVSDITVPEDVRDSPATVRKRVSNDQLSELGVEDQELAIHRYADGEWNQLDTEVASETDSGVVLEAETPGFSYFAVATIEEQADDGEADDGEADDSGANDGEADDGGADDVDDTTEDGIPGFGFIIALVAIIGAALFATRQQ